MKTWRKGIDTDFSGIPDHELEAACLWEMLRGMRSESLPAVCGRYAGVVEAWRGVLDFLEMLRLPGDPIVFPNMAWAELDPPTRGQLIAALTPRAFLMIDAEDAAQLNHRKRFPNAGALLGMSIGSAFDESRGTGLPKDHSWNLTPDPAQPMVQRFGVKIDWSKGLASIRRDIARDLDNWIEAHAPIGTPGTKGFPDPKPRGKGRHIRKPFQAILTWIGWVRRIDMGDSPRIIVQSHIPKPSPSAVDHARANLATKYHEVLGLAFS
jgi:hypothetical protein